MIGGRVLARYERRGYAIARGILPEDIVSKCRSIRVTRHVNTNQPVRWWLRQYLIPFGTAWSHLDISSVSSHLFSVGFRWTPAVFNHWGPTVVIPLKQWCKHTSPLIIPNSHSWLRDPDNDHLVHSPHAIGNARHTAMRPGDALLLHPGTLYRFQHPDPPHGLWIALTQHNR